MNKNFFESFMKKMYVPGLENSQPHPVENAYGT